LLIDHAIATKLAGHHVFKTWSLGRSSVEGRLDAKVVRRTRTTTNLHLQSTEIGFRGAMVTREIVEVRR